MTDNEIICWFAGGEFEKGYWIMPDGNNYRTSELEYHKSWDWLMPVVEKIRLMMPEIKMPRDLESLKEGNHGSEPYLDILALPISTPIAEVRAAVVKFIKWYNEQNHE